MADSLYNIRLLREFSNEYLNKCFYLTLEDMLYAPLVLKVTRSCDSHLNRTFQSRVWTSGSPPWCVSCSPMSWSSSPSSSGGSRASDRTLSSPGTFRS